MITKIEVTDDKQGKFAYERDSEDPSQWRLTKVGGTSLPEGLRYHPSRVLWDMALYINDTLTTTAAKMTAVKKSSRGRRRNEH